MSQTLDPRLGTSVGGYRIDSLIGRGGMSVVYLAEDTHLGRKVALKFLAPELLADAKFRERFVRESRLAASLEHPNIVTVYDAREADGVLYLAMRYVAGTDLRKLIDAEGPLDPGRTVSIIAQAASALDAAHAEGLIHRDVKPGNILITPRSGSLATDRVYLSDFGLTKRATSDSGITATGQFVGTLDYAAPEQFEARALDGRADVYSLGCVLYECLTGEVPFPRENQAALVYAHLHAPPPKVTQKRPALPAGIDQVVARAMAKSPENRYQSAGDLATAAADALGVQPVIPSTPTRPVPGPKRPSRNTLLALGAGVLALIGVVVVLLIANGGGKAGAPSVPANSAALVDYVARVDPTTRQVVGKIQVGQHPIDVAGGEGSVWVLDKDGSVRRVDPVTNKATVIKGVAQDPRAIAAGEGAVWVADGTKGSVHKIDPASNRVAASISMEGTVSDLVVGEGSVWVAVGTQIIQIHASSGDVTEATPGCDLSRFGCWTIDHIGVGGGFVWETNEGGGLGRYSVATGQIDLFQESVSPRALAVYVGDVWVGVCGTPGTVVRVDARTGETAATIAAGGAVCPYVGVPPTPISIAAGIEGVWVTDAVNGTISRIREIDNRAEAPIKVGDAPTAIAVGLGSVWVTVDGTSSS